jgi:putative FmdB family regulatory protein
LPEVTRVPTYEYECGDCQHRFERRQSFDAEPVAMCPECGGKARRVIHSIPVIFKGSGFYITDSRQSRNPGGERASETKEEGKKEP